MWSLIPKDWIAPVLMSIGLVLMALGWTSTYNTLNKERDDHKQVVAQYEQTIKNYKDAQTEANEKAEKERKRILKEAEVNEQIANRQYNDLLTQYRSSIVRYQQAAESGGERPSGGEHQAAQSGNGPSTSSGVLTISMSDAEVCAINTARLIAVRDWAIKLPSK